MKESEIEERFKKSIDQWFAVMPYYNETEATRDATFHIGGILQAALHVIPTRYDALKRYCYEKHGYNPGGVTDGQMTLNDMM